MPGSSSVVASLLTPILRGGNGNTKVLSLAQGFLAGNIPIDQRGLGMENTKQGTRRAPYFPPSSKESTETKIEQVGSRDPRNHKQPLRGLERTVTLVQVPSMADGLARLGQW